MKKFLVFLCAITLVFGVVGIAGAAILTFDDLITGSTSYGFDGDADGVDDVILSTIDPSGFNTVGPGTNMSYIDEPGLEGSTTYDLRVDFLNQAQDYLNFGFALNEFGVSGPPNTWTNFEVYDAGDNLIASDFEYGYYTLYDGVHLSSFPEGLIETSFTGIASYALFDFNNDLSGGQRYIIDNFEGNFGSTEVPPVPEPATMLLLGSGLIGLGVFGRKKFFKKS